MGAAWPCGWGRCTRRGSQAELLGSFPLHRVLGAWLSRPTRVSVSDEEAREGFSPFIPLQTCLVFSPKFPQLKVGRRHDRCRGHSRAAELAQTPAGSRHPHPCFWHGTYLDRLLSPTACLGEPEAVEPGQRTGGIGGNCGMVCGLDFYQKRQGRVSATLKAQRGVAHTESRLWSPECWHSRGTQAGSRPSDLD